MSCLYGYMCITCIPFRMEEDIWIPWKWSYRHLWAALWVLETESMSSIRAVHAVSLWAISPASHPLILSFWSESAGKSLQAIQCQRGHYFQCKYSVLFILVLRNSFRTMLIAVRCEFCVMPWSCSVFFCFKKNSVFCTLLQKCSVFGFPFWTSIERAIKIVT